MAVSIRDRLVAEPRRGRRGWLYLVTGIVVGSVIALVTAFDLWRGLLFNYLYVPYALAGFGYVLLGSAEFVPPGRTRTVAALRLLAYGSFVFAVGLGVVNLILQPVAG